MPITPDMNKVTANFKIKEYSVNFTSGSDREIKGSKIQNIKCNESAEEVTAEPDECYRFIGWTGDRTGTENPLKLTNITKNMNITANFAQIKYQVHFDTIGNGSLVSDTDPNKHLGEILQDVKCGNDSSQITAIPGNNNYKFTGWTGDRTEPENTLTLKNVKSDMSVTANFGLIDSADAPVISIRSGDVNPQSGIFDLNILINNAPECGDVEFTLVYDPTLIFIEDKSYISIGDFWNNTDGIIISSIDDNIPGKLTIKVSLNKDTLSYPMGDGILATIPVGLKDGTERERLGY